MQVARWIGQGDGSQINPFILSVDSNFDFNNSFNIRMENNYLAFRNRLNYFKFENMSTVLLLGVIIKDGKQLTYYRVENSIEMTMFLTNRVDYTDGPYILTTENGVHYLLKQQVFTQSEFEGLGYIPVWMIGPFEPERSNNSDFWFDTSTEDDVSATTIEDLEEVVFADDSEVLVVDLEEEPFVDDSEEDLEDLEEYYSQF